MIGIANTQSIAYGCAKAVRALGAELAITHLNERAEAFVRPLAQELASLITMPCNLENPGELEAVVREPATELGPQGIRVHGRIAMSKSRA